MRFKRLEPQQIIPPFVKRLLCVGDIPPSIRKLGSHKPGMTCFLSDGELPSGPESALEKVDWILLAPTARDITRLRYPLEQYMMLINAHGRILVVFEGIDHLSTAETELDLFLSDTGWIRYLDGAIHLDVDSSTARGIIIVPKTYNPVLHARELSGNGHPDWAITILKEIPEVLIASEETLAMLAVEKQRHYLYWQELRTEQAEAHALFSKERREFAQATAIKPELAESYRIHSRFWSQVGRNDMAERTLRSIEYVRPDSGTRSLLHSLQNSGHRLPTDRGIIADFPNWQNGWPVPRILFITHGTSDYGQDTFFHGLCTILGQENVVEYPWKPTLHNREIDTANNYPCVFDYPGNPISVDDLVDQLSNGLFDVIVYADVIGMENREVVQRLVNADPKLPVVLYDSWDDCYTPIHSLLKYIDRERIDLVFKREMIDCVDYYNSCTYPFPFGYPESLSSMGAPFSERSTEPFWAGRNEFGLRPLYLRCLEKMVGHSLDTRFDQAVYRRKLRSSRIGLSFFGCGFDTVRYWELPANGVMLLAERPPICIPHNFVDDVSAVFFDDVAEMETKLDYYMNRPEEAARIAANGYNHYLRHHTTTSRARQFLSVLYANLSI